MEQIFFEGIGYLLAQICLAAFIVFIAMTIDLGSGLYKAKLRGEVHSSWGLKRSVQKFILYEGAILIAGGIDVLFLTSHVAKLLGCDAIAGIAIFTCMIAILLCVVEIWSLREQAEEKTRKDLNRAGEILGTMLDKKRIADAIGTAIVEGIKQANAQQKHKQEPEPEPNPE